MLKRPSLEANTDERIVALRHTHDVSKESLQVQSDTAFSTAMMLGSLCTVQPPRARDHMDSQLTRPESRHERRVGRDGPDE